MKLSHSRIECFEQCPYKFCLRYIDGLKTKFKLNPSDPLILGTSAHICLQQGLEEGIKNYYNSYPSLTYLHILEATKLEYIIPKVLEILPFNPSAPNVHHEVQVDDNDCVCYLDTLVDVGEVESVKYCDLFDYKYTVNQDSYLTSDQLHLYKWEYEAKHPGVKIRNMFFVFIPKVNNPMFFKGDEEELKANIQEKLEKLKFKKEEIIHKVEYDPNKVIDFFIKGKHVIEAKDYPKKDNKNCQWCEYKKYCSSNGANTEEILKEEI